MLAYLRGRSYVYILLLFHHKYDKTENRQPSLFASFLFKKVESRMARLKSPKTARKVYKKICSSRLASLVLLIFFAANIHNLIRFMNYSDGFELSDTPSLSDDETTTTDDANETTTTTTTTMTTRR